MDIATLIGVLGAFTIVLVAIVFGGDTSPLVFVNAPSLLIVGVGTIMVVMMKYSLKQSIGAFKVASRAFLHPNQSPTGTDCQNRGDFPDCEKERPARSGRCRN